MTRWFNLRNVDDPSAKTLHASTYLEGRASTWFMAYMESQPAAPDSAVVTIPTWDKFIIDIQSFFKPVNQRERLRDQWHDLRQVHSVQEYIAEFRNLSLQIQPTKDESEYKFKRGLKPHIARELTIKAGGEQLSLEAMMSIADNLDQVNRERYIRPSPIPPPRSSMPRSVQNPAPSTAMPDTMEIDATATRHKKLSPQEREQRFKNNLCMYCGQSGHFRNDCPERKSGKATVRA